MDDIGWIALHRHIKNHWVFDDPAQLKAWIIILLEVNHSPGKRLIKGKLLKCQRGQSLKSLSTWGKLFGGWGKPRVNRFFKLLEKDSMIVLKSETVTTRLTVCNYDKYQNHERRYNNMKCVFCDTPIRQEITGEPYLEYKGKPICSNCYVSIIPEIYNMAGYGDGGMIQLIFSELLKSGHNRKKRVQMPNYKRVLKELLHKYKFRCVTCGAKEKLTIDHIRPVSKGGKNEISNLQILCKSCNSSKGNKI